MNFAKSKTKIRKVFMWIAISGVISNFAFDFLAYRQLQSSTESENLVTHSYEVTLHLQKLDRAIELLLIPPVSENKLPGVFAEVAAVKALVRSPLQQELLQKLTNEIQSATATATVTEMLSIESSLLKERIDNDVVLTQQLESSLIRMLAVDSLLIALLLIIFLAEMRTRKKTEENLITSLNYLREANFVLKEQQVKGQRSTKTTIHDLKNPLGSIRGFAELISDELISSPSIREFSDVIKRISQSSLELVDSLLSSSDDVPTKMETVDVVAVLEEACTQIEVQARAKNQTIFRDFSIAGAPMLGNRMKLEELFMNLLSNAIKYSPTSGKIWVRCLPKEGVYKVEIEDQGQGFSNEDKARAFQYGQRLSAKPTGKESSTGFGLFMAKQAIELHNGHIEIGDSKSGVGACVSLELPALSDRDRESKATSPQIDLG